MRGGVVEVESGAVEMRGYACYDLVRLVLCACIWSGTWLGLGGTDMAFTYSRGSTSARIWCLGRW